jgi:hypothetical protein
LIGEDNASLLGALLVTKIQMGAMSRADIDQKDRVPFYLYVDEFQNFATDSFATILSEARKYALNLTVANQYISQMAETVRDAVFGNVGSIITFRTSADDARTMMKYFEPKFTDHDIVHMHNRHILLSMTIAGEKAQAFSAVTLNLPPQPPDHSAAIVQNSRESYAINRAHIESAMNDRYTTLQKPAAPPQPTKQSSFTERRVAVAEAKKPAEPMKDSKDSSSPASPASPEEQKKTVGAKLGSLLAKKDSPTPDASTEIPARPKRKRTRKRKKKTTTPEELKIQKDMKKIEETTINLR